MNNKWTLKKQTFINDRQDIMIVEMKKKCEPIILKLFQLNHFKNFYISNSVM